jgi:hypothetical protein
MTIKMHVENNIAQKKEKKYFIKLHTDFS